MPSKVFFTGKIQGVENSTITTDLAQCLKNQFCRIVAWLDTKIDEEYRAARIVILSGKYRNSDLVFSRISLSPVDIEGALQEKTLCKCRGITGLHTPDTSGCLQNEAGPFCGACGMPCETISKDLSDRAEHFGTPCRVPYFETKSLCCNTEELYNDCNLTVEYEGE